jgi:anti-sigma factor RsiW
MNQELELQIQAYVDGELAEGEARQVAELVARDAAAQALVSELTFTRQALTGNELEIRLPESRDFHWSKITREIQRQEREIAPASVVNWRRWSFKYLSPLAGLALVCLLFVLPERKLETGEASPAAVIENLSSDMVTSTFRSQSDGFKVIWLSEKTDEHATGEEVPTKDDNK